MTEDAPARKPGERDFAEQLTRLKVYIAEFARSSAPPPLYIPRVEPVAPSMTPPLRPAATPSCAGITPGFEHLVDMDRPVTRAELLAIVRALRAERGAARRGGHRG